MSFIPLEGELIINSSELVVAINQNFSNRPPIQPDVWSNKENVTLIVIYTDSVWLL